MKNVLTLIADPCGSGIDDTMIAAARDALAASGADPAAGPDWLASRAACDIVFTGADPAAAQDAVRAELAGMAVDVVAQRCAGRRKKLLVADMESTIIANEFIDELADFAGVGAEVAAITDRVVRGEVAFAAALEQRVAMLAGLPVETLERAYAGLEVNPGARALARTMRAEGARTALVSGGFTCFSARVRAEVDFDSDHANVIEVADGRLTGRVAPPILDRAAKRTRLEALRAELGLAVDDTMAVGDGANDLDMLAAAGMGVAYRAKPVVAAAARARIDHGDLTALLYIQGYRAADFRT